VEAMMADLYRLGLVSDNVKLEKEVIKKRMDKLFDIEIDIMDKIMRDLSKLVTELTDIFYRLYHSTGLSLDISLTGGSKVYKSISTGI
jgi:hypothetical protein